MANTATSKPAQADVPANEDKLGKIRWSMQQRLCEHMRLLLGDLFDEVDDFLFAKAPPGQISGEGSHLRVIREFRNKKQLFEEKFLDSIDSSLHATLIPRQRVVAVGNSNSADRPPESSYEKMEIDLAFERMQRKAFKHYAEQIKQIQAPAREQEIAQNGGRLIPEQRDILVRHTISALAGSHDIFRVSLDNRLVFFKLFEKHFLLNMERLYQEIISIISNKDNEKFIERLYSSSTSISKRRSKGRNVSVISDGSESSSLAFKSRDVELRVNEIVTNWCEGSRPPEFIEKMLRNDWHNVLLLIGLNKDVEAREWQEAQATIQAMLSLLNRTTNSNVHNGSEVESLRSQLRQGFELIQKPTSEQQAFLRRLDEAISTPVNKKSAAETTSIIESSARTERSSQSTSRSYASVSDAGRRLFDSNDLDDFVALLSDDQALAVAEVDEEAISMDYYLNMVDSMVDGANAEMPGSENADACTIQKSNSTDNSYQIMDSNGRVLLTRSRVGLAVSLRAGEIRLEGQEDFSAHGESGDKSRDTDPRKAGGVVSH